MTNLLSDLWHDLREKRLWPVALVLLAALVAVPVVLSKSSEEAPSTAPVTSEAREAPEPRELKGLAEVKLEEASVGTGSSLDTFDPSNPFRPPEKVIKGSEQTDAGSGSTAGPGTSSSANSVPSGTGGGGATGADGGAPSGGGPVDTGPVDTGGDDTGGGDIGGDDTGGGETTTTQYRYVVDVTFRANERTRKIKAMERLDMLPNAASPLLLFLGVAADGGDAVFLVDSTLEAAGEGRCQPSGPECAFLHIGPGSEHEFTDDEGDSYTLRVDEIRRVKVGGGDKATASRNKKPAAKAAIGKRAASRRFVLPVLADFVSVSRAGGINSNSDSERR